MKKRILTILATLLLCGAILAAWLLLGPATAFSESKYSLYIRTGMNYPQLIELLEKDSVLQYPGLFKRIASLSDYPTNLKAGKYDIKRGENLLDILRVLRSGRQTPVNLVITKLRTKKDLASLVGKKLETDSASFIEFLDNNDSLRLFDLDSNSVMTAIYPDTYIFYWNSSPDRIFKKFFATYKNFWTQQHLSEAHSLELNPTTAYILASIVEEETSKKEDKGLIASVYLNRISKGMKLAADPTVKFALGNFELKRIYDNQLLVESPYNTYRNAGLPPGPICTPSPATVEDVLGAPHTAYLYFVAKPDFSGYSNFSDNFKQHLKNARAYQRALDEQIKIGQNLRNEAAH
jgi:UPF0755 protein